jgi:hypothetical protein
VSKFQFIRSDSAFASPVVSNSVSMTRTEDDQRSVTRSVSSESTSGTAISVIRFNAVDEAFSFLSPVSSS